MEADAQSSKQKAEALQALTSGHLSSSFSKLSASSRAIPAGKDFHFYYNFDEFKLPVKEIVSKSESALDRIGKAGEAWGRRSVMSCYPVGDVDEGLDWVVGVNDEILERFDVAVDEFEKVRKKEEEVAAGTSVAAGMDADGFQVVSGRKIRKIGVEKSGEDLSQVNQSVGVAVASKDKKTLGPRPRVPFHIPTITRPQDQYKILVNNANQPFQHVWLQRSEDNSRFVHPLEKLSVLDFVDKNVGDVKPIVPSSVEGTPFSLIEEVKDLKELSAKLRVVDEFAVDLEHNQYRSFQGLTCLMQISTRTEDFIVDTLKLRVHVGPYLREVFKDPTKKKVMHGADRDIIWLQRDFGIYICNLFDTGQASRVLKLERNSLEYLLKHFCGITANKEYQNADWRLRPLPEEMIRYAREDTHYLLYIYDLMKIELGRMPKEIEIADDPLLEVYKRSCDVCMQFYEKELLTEDSYLYIYGLQDANFNAQQLAIVAGLCEWRDVIARAEDESTGYVLPNKALLEIAKQMPVTVNQLRRLVKSKHPYVERNIGAVLSIIFHAIQNASAFEVIAEQLKQGAVGMVQEDNVPVGEVEDMSVPSIMDVEGPSTSSINVAISCEAAPVIEDELVDSSRNEAGVLHENVYSKKIATVPSGYASAFPSEDTTLVPSRAENVQTTVGQSTKVSATVQVTNKPSRAFGALFGSGPKKNLDLKDKEKMKLKQIKSSVNLPFHSFSGTPQLKPAVREEQTQSSRAPHNEVLTRPASNAGNALEDIIVLEDKPATDDLANINKSDTSASAQQEALREKNGAGTAEDASSDENNEPTSLTELSSSFKKCFQSKQADKSEDPSPFLGFKPFDYEAARQQIKFGNGGATGEESNNEGRRKTNKKNTSVTSQERRLEESGGFQPGRRRQAFPASGNRSATFKST